MDSRAVIEFGDFELDSRRFELRRAGAVVPIHPRPLRVFAYLIEHRDRFVTKEELMEAIWPGTNVSEASLATALKEVRQALGDDGQHQRWIKTARGHGFRFVGEINDRDVAAQAGLGAAADTRPRRKSIALSIAVAAALAIAAFFRWQTTPVQQPPPTSIAILAFADLSPNGDHGYLADGISEELISALAQAPELRVTARTSSFAFKGRDVDIREIGRQLGVGVVLEGSIRHTLGRLRVTAQLIDTADGFELWSDTWDQPFDELFELQDEIAHSVADRLQVTLARGTGRPPTGDLQAYELSVRGDALVLEHNAKSLKLSIQYFERALEIDPNYAFAHAGMANALTGMWNHQYWYPEIEEPDHTANSPLFQRALQAAKRAVELHSDSAAHGALAYLLYHGLNDFPAAQREIDLQQELAPGAVSTLFGRSMFKAELGQLDEARAAIDRARELDPLSPLITAVAGEIYYLAGEYDPAIELMEHAEATGAGHGGPHHYLVLAYLAAGRADEFFRLSLEALPSDGPETVKQGLVEAFEQGGIPGLLRYRIKLGRETSGKLCGDESFLTAAFFAVLDEGEQALACLEVAERQNGIGYLKSDPLLAAYRDDPRFIAMLERRGVL